MPTDHDHHLFSAADFMPDEKLDVDILHQRAAVLANHEIQNAEKINSVEYVHFRLGDHEDYGISYQYAKEVMNNIDPTRVPKAPEFIAGVINYRGALVTVIDLKKIFHVASLSYEKDPYIIILAAKNMTVGILADNIVGSNEYTPDSLESPLQFENIIKPEYIIGLDRGLTAIINIEPILVDCQIHLKSKLGVKNF